MQTVYAIPETNMATLEKILARYNRKLAKGTTNGSVCSVNKIATYNRQVSIGSKDSAPAWDKVVTVIVAGMPPSLNGWRIVGSIDMALAQPIVNGIPGSDLDLSAFRANAGHCDHCNIARRRNMTMILQHESGELKQIGKTCLKDFLGHHADPESWADCLQNIREIEANDSDNSPRQANMYDVPEILARAAHFTATVGYVSRKKADQHFDMTHEYLETTGSTIHVSIHGDLKGNGKIASEAIDKRHYDRASFIIAELSVTVASNDFEENLKAIIASELITAKYFGYVAAMTAWQAKREEIAAKKLDKPASIFVGTIKEKVEIEATLVFEKAICGDYGTTFLLKFIDATGNNFSWFASNPPEIEIGQTVKLKGTVKAHDTFNGDKQTILTRCKLA